MNERVIAGKTILLNNATNCTYIANPTDELVQTGSRPNDRHIEIAGQLDIQVVPHEPYEAAARALFILLDNIDTLSNHIKPHDLQGYKRFHDSAMKIVGERKQHMDCDGYNVALKTHTF